MDIYVYKMIVQDPLAKLMPSCHCNGCLLADYYQCKPQGVQHADMLEKEAVRTVLNVSVHTKRTYLHNVH
jgi:hypothetical protein